MPVERSAGIIFYKDTEQGRKYLVLRSTPSQEYQNHWDFSKGVLNDGEKGIDAALREAKEETGISDFKIIEGFKHTARYFRRNRKGKGMIPKFVAMFLARTIHTIVKLSFEHDTYEWIQYKEALERISNREMKKALEAAEEFLRQQ